MNFFSLDVPFKVFTYMGIKLMNVNYCVLIYLLFVQHNYKALLNRVISDIENIKNMVYFLSFKKDMTSVYLIFLSIEYLKV